MDIRLTHIYNVSPTLIRLTFRYMSPKGIVMGLGAEISKCGDRKHLHHEAYVLDDFMDVKVSNKMRHAIVEEIIHRLKESQMLSVTLSKFLEESYKPY